jgi:hypothetical protein
MKQRDGYSCGPVAIINALKWAGVETTKEERKRISNKIKCKQNFGTFKEDFQKYFKQIKYLDSKFFHRLSLKKFKKHIDNGGAIIWIRKLEKEVVGNKVYVWDGHYTFCIGRDKENYLLVNNYYKDKTPKAYKEKYIKTNTKPKKRPNQRRWALAFWLISKKTNET